MKDEFTELLPVSNTERALYTAIEVHGVRDYMDEDEEGTDCRIDDMNPQFFSTYLIMQSGEAFCVGDFSFVSEALAYASRLAKQYKYPITNLCGISVDL